MLILILIFLLFIILFKNSKEDFIDNKKKYNKLCCIYAYYEKDEKYKENFIYFLENGIYDEIDHYIIINGDSSIDVKEKHNIKIFKRENKGYDFGAWSYGLSKINREYDYYIFMNTSVKGPYLHNTCIKWYEPFLRLFNKKDVKIVGTTINILPKEDSYFLSEPINKYYGHEGPFSHIQSMFFIIDLEYLKYLNSIDFFNEEKINKITNFYELILKYEIGLSQHAIIKGWNINCILEPYTNQDYRSINPYIFGNYYGDIYNVNRYFGKTIDPYNVIFYKNNRF
jgi:lipopolysaccharide biosynthesis protein